MVDNSSVASLHYLGLEGSSDINWNYKTQHGIHFTIALYALYYTKTPVLGAGRRLRSTRSEYSRFCIIKCNRKMNAAPILNCNSDDLIFFDPCPDIVFKTNKNGMN